jgi:hypothetical protein
MSDLTALISHSNAYQFDSSDVRDPEIYGVRESPKPNTVAKKAKKRELLAVACSLWLIRERFLHKAAV